MPSKKVLQLGGGQLMTHSISLLKQIGLHVYVVDRNPNAPGFALADDYAPVDIGDVDAVTDFAQRIGVDVILAVNEAGVLAAAKAGDQLGLLNPTPEVALRCLDKGLMRECWQKAGLSQPAFQVAQTPEQIGEAAGALGYPVIIKPAMNWGSRGVSLVAEKAGLLWAIEFAQTHCRNGRYIVEEAISGTEMTIEGLVQQGRPQILARSDKESQVHSKYRVAMALNYPAQFAQSQLQLADETVTEAARALGIENGAFHCECMINEHGVFLLEMGGRPGGGHIFSQIVEAVSGVCMPQALVRILLGERVDITPRYQRGACYKFFTPPPGIFQGASGVEEARQTSGILDFGFSMQPGTVVEAITGDADRPGFAVSTGATREEAIANADRAIGMVRYIMGQKKTL